MDATEEKELNESFDSSIELDLLSLTETMNSEQPQVARAANLNFDDQFAFDSITMTPEKQKNFLQIPKDAFVANTFVGFKNAWGDKEIMINHSKLKRAKKFFDDTQLQDQPECNTVGFGGFEFTTIRPEPDEEYSMPCFKSVGTGALVKISDQAKQKASLFREFQSIKKPTKVKKTLQIDNQSIIKTYNVESKFKMEGGITNVNRKSFNWEEYQKEFKQQIERDIKEGSKKSKRVTEPKRKKGKHIMNSNKDYVFIKLFALNISSEAQTASSFKLATQVRSIPSMKFYHKQDQCAIVQCVFCKIGSKLQNFQVKQIYNILNKQFSKKWVKYQQFYALYMEVCFKLLKYQAYWPDIINKRCHVSNIVVEINKKLLLTQKQSQTSYLRYCIVNQQVGRRINLIIQDKYFNQKMNIVFVKLSDGWTSVWAAIEEKNLLFDYVREGNKAKIGTKLALSIWSIHPISNILHFCNQAEDKSAKCIEFFYNGSIILHPNAKLGHTNEEFYRPLDKCRVKGGFIPVVQGIIMRLFSIKTVSKRGRSQSSFSLTSHFAEILTVQGFVCLVKFSLNEQSSLVEYFRLYHTFRLYKVKIISQENVLCYLMKQSRYEEVKGDKISEKDQIYPQRVCKLLSKRLLNVKNAVQWQDGIYDVLCKDKKVVMNCGKQYEFEIEGEIANYSSLYQQVKVERITDYFIKIYKIKQSSQLRKFPKIYDQLTQTQ